MPANLTPEYEKADLRYRQSTTDEERIEALRMMLSAIPKHKGTEKMQADLKRRLSQLRRDEQKGAHLKGPDPFHVPKTGAGQVVLLGPPNSGKSSLLNATTHARAKVANYPFTTTVPQPGMWMHEDVGLELVDTPPVTPEHVPAGLMGTVRNADALALVVEDGENALEHGSLLLELLSVRGIKLCSASRGHLRTDLDGLWPGLLVLNKTDVVSESAASALSELYPDLRCVPVSTLTRQGLSELFQRLWSILGMIRVYSKEPGRPPDLHKPFTLPEGATVEQLARHIHRELPERLKFARLWGHSRFEGQQVHKTEPLRDRDIVEIHE